MKANFLSRRETAILVFPVATLIIVGTWMNARNQEQQRQKIGPLRTVITSVEVQDVTPFEAWQGFERKVVVKAELQGQNEIPNGLSLFPNPEMTSDVHLSGKISGREQKVGIGTKTSSPWNVDTINKVPLSAVYNFSPQFGYDTFLIRASRFDSAPLHLRGAVRIRQRAALTPRGARAPSGWKIRSRSQTLGDVAERVSRSAPFDVLIPRNAPRIDKKAPEVLEVEKVSLSPHSEKTDPFEGEGETTVRIKFKPFTGGVDEPFGNKDRLYIGPTGIFDAKNQRVEFQKKRGREVALRPNGIAGLSEGTWKIERKLPVWEIPTSRGALRYRTFISRAGSWPVKIEIPLRTAVESLPPKSLKLESVHAESGNVRVRVRYLGVKNVATQQFSRFFDDREYSSIRRLPKTADEDRLISNWSQHLTAPSGKEYWFPNAVSVQSVGEVAPKIYEIVYKTSALAALHPGQKLKFSAHVGTEGEGFLPVEAKIRKLP